MENIIYSVKTIGLLPSRVWNPSIKGQFCKNEEFPFPFERLCIEVQQEHRCPFCGKPVVMFHCDCEKFMTQFVKLQDSVHDEKHKTVLHLHPYENLFGESSVSSSSIEPLTVQETNELGPDFWDDAQRIFDAKTNRFFYVVNLIYKEECFEFICKDLQTKVVYRCYVKGYSYHNHKIYLGIFYDKSIRHGDIAGNDSKRRACKDFIVFEHWEALCKELQSIGKIMSKVFNVERLFL